MDLLKNPIVLAAIISGSCVVLAAIVARNTADSILSERRKHRISKARGKLRHACPHIEIVIESNQAGIRALLISPPGSLFYFCSLCGGAFHREDVARLQKAWMDRYVQNDKMAIGRLKNTYHVMPLQ